MNKVGFLYLIFITLMTSFGKQDIDMLALPVTIINIIFMISFGMYANAFYYNHINKKIRDLDLKTDKTVVYVFAAIMGLAVIGIIAAINISKMKVEAPAPVPAPAVEAPRTFKDPYAQPAVKKVYSPGWTITYSGDISEYIDYSSIKNTGPNTITFKRKYLFPHHEVISEMIATDEADCSEMKTRRINGIDDMTIFRDGSIRPGSASTNWFPQTAGSYGYNIISAACNIARGQ